MSIKQAGQLAIYMASVVGRGEKQASKQAGRPYGVWGGQEVLAQRLTISHTSPSPLLSPHHKKTQEFSKGFAIGGKVIRPAKVACSTGPGP